MLGEDSRKCFLSVLKKGRTEDREGIEEGPPCPAIMVLKDEVAKTGEKAGTGGATEIGEPASITDCRRASKRPWITLSSFWRNSAAECWRDPLRDCERADLCKRKGTCRGLDQRVLSPLPKQGGQSIA